METKILNELVTVLLDKNTISKAIIQKAKKADIQPIDASGINFRLFQSEKGNINLEFFGRDQFGCFFKPIGFYKFDVKNMLVGIYILKEFEESYKEIENEISKDLKEYVKFMSLEENIYISMCSRETSNVVKNMFKKLDSESQEPSYLRKHQFEKLISNGIKIIIKPSMMGSLEVNLNADEIEDNEDENEFDDDIFVIYQNYDGISLHCQEETYSNLFEMGLFSAFK